MFNDHDNLSQQLDAAAAVPAPDPDSTQEENQPAIDPSAETASPQAAETAAAPESTEAPPASEKAAGEATSLKAETPGETPVAEAPPSGQDASGGVGEGQTPEETAAAVELSQLIDQYSEPQEAPAQDEILNVKVVAYTELGVVVDIGSKSEALIPAAEFTEAEVPKPDPETTIEVQRTGEKKDGYIIVSYLRALRRRAWEKIETAYKGKESITAKIVDRIKGGLVVDIGVRAFLPASQYDLRPTATLDNLVGQEIECRVTKLNRRRGNVVVSRRALLEEALHAQRAALLDQLSEGQVVRGRVKNITDYGVFVDLGGLDGLLHVTDLSWGRVKHPSEVLKPDGEIDVQILKFDKEKQRVSLGLKQLQKDPWETAARKYPAGSKVKGKVAGIVDYGCFVELESGVEGLVHITEMSWAKKLQHPSKLVKVGDEVDVMVLDIKPSDRRVSLGMKQALPDPWMQVAEKYPIGSVVAGKVRNIADFGVFVEIENGFDGLVHVSDVSWSGRIKNPHEHFKKGDAVTAKVLKIDGENRRISLGIKQLHDIWGDWFKSHKVGQVVKGKVSRIATFGAFVELGENIEGLCHNTEIEERRRREDGSGSRFGRSAAPAKVTGLLEVGKEYEFKIIKINHEQRRIGLSYRAAVRQAERREIEQYRATKSSATATIGDAILSKRESL
jgi:small subunit ribosomal protein S1